MLRARALLGLAGVVLLAAGCSGTNPAGSGSPTPGIHHVPSCSCDGTGPGDVPVTVDCGSTACGSDNNTYLCNSPGGDDSWTFSAAGCGATDGGTTDMAGICSCDGTGPGDVPVSAACGGTACGSDNNTYLCNSPGGDSSWTFAESGCCTPSCTGVCGGSDGCGGTCPNNCVSPDTCGGAGTPNVCGHSDCSCTGSGPGDVPVTANCGSTACGSDNNTYLCNSPGGDDSWTFSASGCGTTDGGTPDMASGCSCEGTGPGDAPISAACGSTACGSDNNTYLCNSPGGSNWSLSSTGCGATDGGVPDMTSSCSCEGTGPGDVPVSAACGSTACGSDNNTYLCNSPGGGNWSFAESGCCTPSCTGLCGGSDGCGGTCPDNCVSPDTCGGAGTPNVCGHSDCSCSGDGPGGTPVTANCGATACGDDNNTYLCNSPGGSNWTFAASGCSGGQDLGCTCTGTGPGDVPVTVNCGQNACGSDNNTYSCSASGWSFLTPGCPS